MAKKLTLTHITTEEFLKRLDEKMRTGKLNPTDPILKKCSNHGLAAAQFFRQLSDPTCSDYAPQIDTKGMTFYG